MKRFSQIFTLLALPTDFVAVWVSFLVAYWLRVNWQFKEVIFVQPFDDFIVFALWAGLLWVLTLACLGLYSFKGFKNTLGLAARFMVASSVALALLIIVLFLTKTTFFSRLIVIYLWILTPICLLIGRSLLSFIRQWFQYSGAGVEKVVIVAKDRVATILRSHVEGMRPSQALLAVLASPDWNILKQADRVIVGYELDRDAMLQLIRFCEDNGIALQYIPSLTGLYTSQMTIDTISGYPIIELSPTPLAGWGRIAKRTFDIVVSTIGIIVLSPVMLAVATAIKLNSKGPIIFAQPRVGRRGELFTFYKFRSMYTEMSTGEGYGGKQAEALRAKLAAELNEASGLLFKIKDDPRVTRVGKFIRRTSLDELPQLFNVFIGNMSAVGPRPALPSEVAQYDDATKRRLLIKPGVTGLWQASGRSDASFEDYVKLDTFYIEHWSLWLDIKIILLTFKAVFSRKGSY
ncbi:MAG: sugar transferase [Patescibacteria group bacterium]|nr:sugar transferase [Patescibacteria group bacterium]